MQIHCERKKINKYINDELEISVDEETSDEENSNEETSEKEDNAFKLM